MTAKQQNIYDTILRFVITVLVAVVTFYSQKFVTAVDKLNETVTILTTEQKQNKEDLTELKANCKNHESRITVLETKELKQ